MITALILVIGLTLSCLSIWFDSNFRTHLFKWFKIIPKDLFTVDEVSRYLMINKGLFGEWATCPICFGTWLAAFWTIFFIGWMNLPVWFLFAIFSPQIFIKFLFK